MRIVFRIVTWTVVALLIVGAAFGALNHLASERIEVVTLHTVDAEGQPVDTRLWILDHDGQAFLRTSPGSGWHARIVAQGTFELTRGAQRAAYTVVERPELRDAINAGFNAKYTWGDDFIGLVLGGRSNSIALQLLPAAD